MATPGTPLSPARWRCSCSIEAAAHWLDLQAGAALDTGGEAAAILGDVVGHYLAVVRRAVA